jgi:amino acid adenylation domain-containing protein
VRLPGIEECLPLSYSQETVWFAEQMTPGTPMYNLPEAWQIRGKINPRLLQEAFDELVCRHETLRTCFRVRDGKPAQVISATARVELTLADLTQNCDPAGEAQRRLASEARVPFDLSRAPLARAMLFQTGPQDHVLFLNLHHLVSDAASQSILIQELINSYTARAVGQKPDISEPAIQFADFCLWQRDLLDSDLGQSHLAYWRNKLRTIPRATCLVSDRLRLEAGTHRGATHFFKLSGDLKNELREIGRRADATVFMVLLAAFKVLLHRYTLEEQIMAGIPMACRDRIELERLIGFFVHTQAVCTDLGADPGFLQLVSQVREAVLEAAEHQDVPCDLAVQGQPGLRSIGRQPLFQFVFGWQGTSLETIAGPGFTASKIELETGTAKFDWTVLVSEVADGLLLRSEFSTDLFEPETMMRMLHQFQTLLESVASNPSLSISQLELEKPSERQNLLSVFSPEICEYERESRIQEVFEAQVAVRPHAVAVEFAQERVSYAELNRRANQLANYLNARGLRPGTNVGLCLNRSVEMVVGILGILKAGGAYVPLDPENPLERLQCVLEDCQIRVVVTSSDFVCRLPLSSHHPAVLLDADKEKVAAASELNPTWPGRSTDLAYVMYTSGSTGIPKGAAVPHRAVVRLVRNTNYLKFSSDLVFLQYAPISFDASTFEIWGALLNGAKLVVAAPGILSHEELGKTIRERRVTTIWLTAGLFNQMVDHRLQDLRGLKHTLTGGETLSPPHVSQALGALTSCQLINGYGPTENTTFTCCYGLPSSWPATRPVPIGRPIANTRVYVLDKNMVPVPVGVPGELYAGGDGLALGYINRPQLTAERFVPDPFAPGSLLYRTGDLVRWSADGTLEFLRRADDQVKIRGHRVEPGEVEHVLAHFEAVESCAVVARADQSGTKQLVAYVVERSGTSCGPDQLRGFLRTKLPSYAVPAEIIVARELPLNLNGKVDRHVLAQLPILESRSQTRSLMPPRTDTEAKLLEIWREVLGKRALGIDEDFFELGGHSLLAMQVISRIADVLKKEVAVGAVFEASTVAQLAAVVDAAGATQTMSDSSTIAFMDSAQAACLLQKLDQFSEAELDQLLQDTQLQSTQ